MGNGFEPLNILKDQFLVDRLLGESAENLTGLIKSLTGGDGGRIATGASVKNMCLTALKRGVFTQGALEVVVAELQNYGGNAVANIARGAGVSYAEILNDTLDYLGGEGVRDQQVELLEERIIRREMELLWTKGDSNLQRLICNALGVPPQWAKVRGSLEHESGLHAAAKFLCDADFDDELLHADANFSSDPIVGAGLTGGVVGAGLGKLFTNFFNNTAPGYFKGKLGSAISSHRVTLPCIHHLTRIRLSRALADERADMPAVVSKLEGRLLTEGSSDMPLGESFVISDSEGNTAFTMIEMATRAIPDSVRRLDMKSADISRLTPLMQAIPTAAFANEVKSERLMKVVIDGPLTLAKDGNGFRGFAKGADGKIHEHVRLFDGELSEVVNAAALFNVASFALAQKHLADISARLDTIQQGVGKISAFQERGRNAEIIGAINYLTQIAEPIMAGERRAAHEHQLEDAEARLVDVQEHLKQDLEALITDIAGAKDEGRLGKSTFRDRLMALQGDFDELAHQWKLCLASRMMACRLLCNFPGVHRTVTSREAAFEGAFHWLMDVENGAIARMVSALESRLCEFSTAYGDSRIELQASRETLLITQMASLPILTLQTDQLYRQFGAMMVESRHPVELLVSIHNGRISELMVA